MTSTKIVFLFCWLFLLGRDTFVQARQNPADHDDGYRLWLKYDPIADPATRSSYVKAIQFIAASAAHPIIQSASAELQQGLNGLLGKSVPVISSPNGKTGGIILKLIKDKSLALANPEGFRIDLVNGTITITSETEPGILYGSFALLRHIQTLRPLNTVSQTSSPRVQLRMLNHWDNTDGSIERGYAGSSLWKWYELPERIDPRYRDYARANASLGINGCVVNNVNASARFMSAEYIGKVAALANVFRAYGIKLYLSVYFAAPKTLGGLTTSDPLDPQVQAWWAAKVKEIYQSIPDFGGFLVKANSEGEPGPQDYGRNHADGANMLAEAFEPYDGVVIWRAFVYKADPNADRFKAAYEEFVPLDGKFHKKVVVQVKNGPIDFQPREPFSPLFGNMPKTPLGMEFQLTQEYFGFATHAVYEAPIFKECLESDTYVQGKSSTVGKIVDGSLHGYSKTVMAGVANTGSARNWTGHTLAQANWYAFGRLAWDHEQTSEEIVREWIAMTLTHERKAADRIANLMLRSREIYVNYNTPLGLSRPWTGVHFAPEPWQNRSSRPDWTAVYYHRADSSGLGFDRTAGGSNALGQYRPEVQKQWNDPDRCPLPYLLWFHHVAWDKKLSSGKTLWDELCTRFYTGADSVLWMQKEWASVQTQVHPEIFADVSERLLVQHREAVWWRNAWVLYLQSFSKKPIPAPFKKPGQTLAEVMKSVDIYLLR
jgi:alpha-glucuronidase